MSEHNFSCPACGQNILADTAHVGTEITCPACHASIIVPEETTDLASASVPPEIAPVQQTSGLAIASLICSILSLVTCIGWLPGIICGHLARSRIRRNPLLKGGRLATAGLLIGYLFLLLETGTAAVHLWRFSAAVKQGYANVRLDLATNNLMITQPIASTVSNASLAGEIAPPVAVTPSATPANSTSTGWKLDSGNMMFPANPIGGKLHGSDFVLKTAWFRNGDLKITSTSGLSLDLHNLGETIEGASYEVQPADDGGIPHVRMTWQEGDVTQTATYNKGYAMKLQFGPAMKRKVAAKIYLCFPDDAKSCVAGTFEVRLLKPK
jgi:DNA-directed RNA polymerase subunit RPC12/RpoP